MSLISKYLTTHYNKPVIYDAPNGNVGLLKLKNAAVDIVIVDSESNTPDSMKMVEVLLLENANPHMAVIILGPAPEEENFIDELITGRMYFIESLNELEFSQVLAKALNFTSHTNPAVFYLRYLAAGDVLIREGDKAEFVYILKRGQLQAFNVIKEVKNIIGNIEVGEFVGEMSYINHEPRSAYIEALTDSELIEVPIHLVDKILFKRPSWSKALMQTLSKRLKIANQHLIKK